MARTQCHIKGGPVNEISGLARYANLVLPLRWLRKHPGSTKKKSVAESVQISRSAAGESLPFGAWI